MLVKNILKTLGFMLISSIAFVNGEDEDERNPCNEDIKNYIKGENDKFDFFCKYNSSGEVIELEAINITSPRNIFLHEFIINSLSKLQTIKKLKIYEGILKQNDIDEISLLKNLENLDLSFCALEVDFSPLVNNKKLTSLSIEQGIDDNGYMSEHSINEFPKVLTEITSLKELSYKGIYFDELPEEFCNLKNLELINFNHSELRKLPKCLKDLKSIKEFFCWNCNLDVLPDLSGSCNTLSEVNFEPIRNVPCIEKDTPDCLKKFDFYKDASYCKDSKTTNTKKTITSTTEKTSRTTSKTKETVNGRCGKDYGNGKCPSGECCSKYGYCGRSDAHCNVSRGCQSEFGQCQSSSTTTKTTVKKTTTKSSSIPTSTNGKCGSKNGKCPSGECCSKYGYCGRSDAHCNVSRGCQSEFGQCQSSASTTTSTTTTTTTKNSTLPTSSNGKCGKKYGSCPSGECCSKYGYCGRSDAHCNVSRGCQSEFGQCQSSPTTTTKTTIKKTTIRSSSLPTSTNGKCGSKNGKCPSGECCSKYGYCGRSDAHCKVSRGCQSEFGKCK